MDATRIVRTGAAIGALVLSAGRASGWQEGLVVTSDYVASGAVTSFQREAPWSPVPDRETVHQDAVARWHEGLVWVVNRQGADNLQVLDPAAGYQTTRQFAYGPDRNLQDIAFDAQGEAYVSCYDTAELLRIDPADGAILGVISTAAFADADGLPETGWLLMARGLLFVTCERLDRDHWYQPVGDSYLLVLDPTTEQWVDCDPASPGVDGVRLAGADPYGEPRRDGDRILVPCLANYTLADGGVDVVDAVGLVSLGFEITEAQLGGDVLDVELGPDGRRHAIVSDASFRTAVKRYDPSLADVDLVTQAGGYWYADLAWDGDDQLFLADRTPLASGLRVYDARTGASLTPAPLPTGLPPARFALPVSAPVATPEAPHSGRLALAAPWPNPANPLTTVTFTASPGAVVDLRVVDLRGRVARRDRALADGQGTGSWTFDGRDERGRPLASGAYRVVAESAGGSASRSLIVLR